MKDPIELAVIYLFEFFGFTELSEKWKAETPSWAKYTSKINKILAFISLSVGTTDSFIHFLPEEITKFFFVLAGINVSLTIWANTQVKK